VVIAFERVPEHVANPRGIRSERRHRAFRQLRRQQAETLEDACAGEVRIDVIFEHDVDHREAECRLRAHHAHSGQPLQVHRHGIADLVLDFLCAVALPVGEDDDLVVR
jgi:hypothetical protein